MSTSPQLGLTYLSAAQAQKHVTVNEALRTIDAMVNLAVLDRSLHTPPAEPDEGDVYIITSAGGYGDWYEKEKHIAHYVDGAWQFVAPKLGMRAFVIDELVFVYFNGTSWTTMPGFAGSSLIISDEGSEIGTRGELNLIAGANVTIDVSDDDVNGKVDVTITATGSTGSGVVEFSGLSDTAIATVDLVVFGDASDSNTNKKRAVADVFADLGVLTTADEGTGNGLDADTVDGMEAAAFATASHDHDAAYAALAHNHDTAYAAISHTHSADDITTGTFADARIAESNVTQHQTALSITESQISDLGSYAELDDDNNFGGYELANYKVASVSKTAAYTLTAADSGSVIELDHASGATITVPNSLPVGFICEIAQVGAGAATIAAGSGATMRQRQGHTKTAGQWAVAGIRVRANAGGSAAEFVLSGDTAS